MSTLSNRINQQEPNMREIISDNLLTAHNPTICGFDRFHYILVVIENPTNQGRYGE